MSESAPPPAFRQVVLKVHARCDLACDYCYVYTKADQRWRNRPRTMSAETLRYSAFRIAEHARAHRLDAVDVVLHGGEPLLVGPAALADCVRTLRAAAGPDLRLAITVQTNGVRLTEEFLDLFHRLDVRVGVSLDGGPAAHDRHRRRPDGSGSYAAVAAALRRLGAPSRRRLFAGILSTVDLDNDPVRTYTELLEFRPPVLDFLLPQGNWGAPPPGRGADAAATPYGDWLIEVFSRWYGAPHRETRIRLFEEIISVLLGGRSGMEGIGTGATPFLVVETDGAIEQSDVLAAAYSGAAATGLAVARDEFDVALRLPEFAESGPPAACRPCPVRETCGGGLRAHRFHPDTGFANPSVYCPDLLHLIGHIRDRVAADLADLRAGSG
jgi:uncharacterized protein